MEKVTFHKTTTDFHQFSIVDHNLKFCSTTLEVAKGFRKLCCQLGGSICKLPDHFPQFGVIDYKQIDKRNKSTLSKTLSQDLKNHIRKRTLGLCFKFPEIPIVSPSVRAQVAILNIPSLSHPQCKYKILFAE